MDLQSPRPATTVRRNPPRRAKQASETLDRSLSTSSKIVAVDGINPFPLHEILEAEPSSLIDPPSTQNPLKSSGNLSNNLKVFLRIRPLECRALKCSKVAGEETRAPVRGKVAKGVERKNGACLSVNSSSSVTLSAPPSAPDSKRVKSEIYDGFSHVFPPDSLQDDIYEKLMQPLVKNFMEGHSSLLVAMGPTGSGKTYTMFGSPQQLGIVPLALSQIFTQKVENENAPVSRTYYLSMFEIQSERGKGEKILDLSPESTDTARPQTSISSVKEVKITTAIDAENIVSHGIFKRSTAPTNANNQSSRSQCIVNVRCVWKNGTDDCSISSAVLTIADLAGAERERKTGNQGARLLESNFINNTSMVFGLCLRSLLEHQKNPRKPIEKHYKNSLLTRYLQDYMEGKKQMTLILTVKAAEEDYMDTSFILRQASPYMKIKFNQLQENKNAPCQKRNAPAIKTERSKRRKVNISEASLTDGSHVMVDAAPTSQISQREMSVKSDSADEASISKHINAEVHIELQKIKRSEEVMSNFASAFWSMLKQYKYKLKIAENEVQYLKDSLREKSAQTTELEKELKELRNLCSCLQKSPPVEESVKDLSFNNVILVPSISLDLDRLHDTDTLPDEHTLLSAETSRATEMDRDATTIDKSDMDKLSLPVHQDILQQLEISGKTCSSLSEENAKELTYQHEDDNPECQQNIAKSDILVGGMNDVVMDLSTDTSLTVALEGEGCISLLPGNAVVSIMKEQKDQLAVKIAVSQKEQQDPRSHTSDALTKIAVSQKEQQDPRSHTSDALTNETDDPALRPLNSKRPKRKLLPASEMLLKDLNWLVMDENAKEIKSKESANAKGRSEGSDSLIRILKSNLPR